MVDFRKITINTGQPQRKLVASYGLAYYKNLFKNNYLKFIRAVLKTELPVHDTNEVRVIKINSKQIKWFTFSASPCFALGVAQKNSRGKIVKVGAAHFAAKTPASEIDKFLFQEMGPIPRGHTLEVKIAGSSQRSSVETLAEDLQAYVEVFRKYGIDAYLAGDKKNPKIVVGKERRCISEVGKSFQGDKKRLDRFICYGINTEEDMMFTIFNKNLHIKKDIKSLNIISSEGLETFLPR